VITEEHVRQLLDAEDPDATLVMVEGSPVVRSGPEADRALAVISKADLLGMGDERLGDLTEVAATLDTVVRELGG
jgi:hypothetical protein